MKVKDLYRKIRDGKIISDIELQRDIVYNDEKQALVIDSIVNKIPLHAFYFWKNRNGKLEVLDGKQRIHAIKRFKENIKQIQTDVLTFDVLSNILDQNSKLKSIKPMQEVELTSLIIKAPTLLF